MEFVNTVEGEVLLSRAEFIALDDEAKLTYFAAKLPSFEKKLLLGMLTASKDATAKVDDENDVFTCVSKCHCDGGFDVLTFQYNVTKLVVKKATTLANAIWTDLFAFLST